ncbi:MAG: hypothetical protein PHW60_08130 [Kiritimatiellae bacterium]|nr:hypothetical protein [Kiritimatiellia bacterium]
MNTQDNLQSFDKHTLHIATAYMTAKETVIEQGYADEIDWQDCLDFNDITECFFLRESAWVILSAGMNERVIKNKFLAISSAFCNWESAAIIVKNSLRCRQVALAIFGNIKKVDAILDTARILKERGFQTVKTEILEYGVDSIRQFPYMGPATSFHLAKNLGLPLAKPDRHLVRVARKTGFPSPAVMCDRISQVVGDKVPVIDLVIWRYATINRQYLNLF